MKRFRVRGKGGVLGEGINFRDGQVVFRERPFDLELSAGKGATTGSQPAGKVSIFKNTLELAIYITGLFREPVVEWVDSANSDWLGLAKSFEEYSKRHDRRGFNEDIK